MNNQTFEQVTLNKANLNESELFLQDGDKVLLQEFN
jgi:translation elongation factor P/translation initiation factor 5A